MTDKQKTCPPRPWQNGHVQVSHEGNKLSTISVSHVSASALYRATFGAVWRSVLGEDMFSLSLFPSPVSLWLGFFLSSQTRQTSDPTPDWLRSFRSPQQLASQAASLFLSLPLPPSRLSLSLSLSPSLLSWPCSRVGWFGMTISQGRNADNRSELPGVAASQLTRNKAFLTD